MMAVVSEARPQQWLPRHLFGLKLIKVLSGAGFNRIPDNAVYPHFSLFRWIFKRAFSKHESVFNPAPNLTRGGFDFYLLTKADSGRLVLPDFSIPVYVWSFK